MTFTILITKETRAGETRVALTPLDAKKLIGAGHLIITEHNAGEKAGFTDQDYISAGASIRFLENDSLASYGKLFNHITHIIRVKRPERTRETLENQAITNGTIMIGALDPLEQHAPHIQEYRQAGIEMHSIDQLLLPPDHPMNVLAAMSKIAGRLALLDAINKFQGEAKNVVIIGFGAAGQSAFNEAIKLKLSITVVLSNTQQTNQITLAGARVALMPRQLSLTDQQTLVHNEVSNADIVITSARKNNEPAPLLITKDTLKKMQPGTVIVDLALSEGGNVAGSKHDATLSLGNDVIVTNVSGYPKAEPHDASVLWSQASSLYLQELALK